MSTDIPQTKSEWVNRLGRYQWYYDYDDLLYLHTALHAQFGDDPPDDIIPVEQELTVIMRSNGYEHRHTDELAKRAATLVANPSPVTMTEIKAYISHITLDTDAIELVQDTDGGPVYLNVRSGLLRGQESMLRKLINKAMPPGVTIKALGRSATGTFASAYTIYSLKLNKRDYVDVRTTTWDVVTAHLRAAAAAASTVFKEDRDPSINFTVMKSEDEEEERIVTGAVLVPDVPDLTTKNADGSDTGAVGDIYDAETIRSAMFWWAENAGRTFSYHHLGKSGQLLNEDDVKLLEIWQVRKTYKENGQEIPKGTWMMTARVHHDALWDQIQKGEIQSWSIGAHAIGAIEEVDADLLQAHA